MVDQPERCAFRFCAEGNRAVSHRFPGSVYRCNGQSGEIIGDQVDYGYEGGVGLNPGQGTPPQIDIRFLDDPQVEIFFIIRTVFPEEDG